MNLHRTILKCTLSQTWEYVIISPKIFSQELTVYRRKITCIRFEDKVKHIVYENVEEQRTYLELILVVSQKLHPTSQ